eukprot:CAMPEP_0170452578 /NCGR_PEP_ID=MMETSP0123-20130129/1427_1 /TAXON_ID=182087 /ORGANISM="Favella ehrenbergii, Strain Fehren 1" /LENGTH=80 /DNA_ID=CAMNT_0010714625 /DNA_START=440 /DNA_END=682 /DNA_ORIENTATION=+
MQLSSTVKQNETSLEEMDFLRKQAIDKDARVQELLLEKASLEEQHAKEVDEITETGVQEISELETKLEQVYDKMIEAESK